MPYKLKIDGVIYGPDVIGSITLASSVSGYGVGATVTQQLSATIYDPIVGGSHLIGSFSKHAEVEILGYETGLTKFYIDSQTSSDNSISITCFDAGKDLSQAFDYSVLKSADGTYPYRVLTSLLVGAIATQCGLAGAVNTSELPLYTDTDKVKTSCNSVIEMIAAASGCYTIIDSSNRLKFMKVGVGEYSCIAYDTSVITSYPQTQITRIVCKGDSSDIYDVGTGTSILEISSAAITEATTDILAQQFINFVYYPYSFTALIGGYLTPWGECDSRKITSISISLNALGAVATLSTPVIADNPYKDIINRMINARVSEGVYYDNIQISASNGLGFRSRTEAVKNSD